LLLSALADDVFGVRGGRRVTQLLCEVLQQRRLLSGWGVDPNRGVHATGERTTIVTGQGKPGTAARVTGPQTGGVIAAFVFDGRGVEAVATGPSDTGPDTTAAILRMIRTISYPGGGKQ
jgi:hypothetical protein